MINKVKYYFCTDNYTGEIRDTCEESIQDAREYLKTHNDYCFIFRQEFWAAFDKDGHLIYESHSKYREFNAESEVNKNVQDYQNES